MTLEAANNSPGIPTAAEAHSRTVPMGSPPMTVLGQDSRYEVCFCTGNPDKVIEVRQLTADQKGVKIDATAVDLPELQGDPQTITRQKCRKAFEIVGRPVIVEDVSLCFNALGGLPGPYIRCFLANLQCGGLYQLLAGFDDKTAYALCVFGFWDGKTADPILFEGRTDGIIVEPRGPQTFGWDPCFEPTPTTTSDGVVVGDEKKTYSQMAKPEKHMLSHRARAMAKLKEFLTSQAAAFESSSAKSGAAGIVEVNDTDRTNKARCIREVAGHDAPQ